MDPSVPDLHPAWFDSLLEDVERVFAETGRLTPGWEDPHPDRNPPLEEYSRCSDPAKYAIVQTRVAAWIQVLTAREMVDAIDREPRPWLDAVRPPEMLARTRHLEPRAPGGLTLVLASTLVDGAVLGLDVGFGDGRGRTVLVDTVPDCGWDACDSGSADLLRTIDGWVLTAARGGVLHARSGSSHITRTLDGWKGTGQRRDQGWLDGSAPAPDGVDRWTGSAWR